MKLGAAHTAALNPQMTHLLKVCKQHCSTVLLGPCRASLDSAYPLLHPLQNACGAAQLEHPRQGWAQAGSHAACGRGVQTGRLQRQVGEDTSRVGQQHQNTLHRDRQSSSCFLLPAQVDDDSYVRVGPLLQRLRALPTSHAFLGNMENPGGRPHRDPKNKWHVSRQEWGGEKYPPWAHGAGAAPLVLCSHWPLPDPASSYTSTVAFGRDCCCSVRQNGHVSHLFRLPPQHRSHQRGCCCMPDGCQSECLKR